MAMKSFLINSIFGFAVSLVHAWTLLEYRTTGEVSSRAVSTFRLNHSLLLAEQQTCPNSYSNEDATPRPYAQVSLPRGSALTPRSSPDGSAIGVIPNDWQVMIVRRDPTGRWAYVTDGIRGGRFGRVSYASAPLFQPGWVETSALVDLGKHCRKPMNAISAHIPALGGQLQVQADWVQAGDAIAQSLTRRSDDAA